ncbi:MAG: hypothetical protein HDT21_10740 [Ruminococcus sp.]|nr:hypothetical protein [Ruminococcus sp.]
MNSETDVLEFDFPDYEEPYPPFPDVKVALFDKEDSYQRNIELAKQLPPDNAEPVEKAKPIPRKKNAPKPRGVKTVTAAAAAYAAALIGIVAIVFIANVQKPEEIGGMNLTIRSDYEECAEFEQRLENIFSNTVSDGHQKYYVTFGFTMTNISDDPVIFFPKELSADIDGSASPPVATEGTRDFDGGVFTVINGQKDFSVTYCLDENEISEITGFGYSLPYRYRIDIDSKVKEEIAAFLSDETQEDIS